MNASQILLSLKVTMFFLLFSLTINVVCIAQKKSEEHLSSFLIIQNLQRIVDENEKLRTELNQKTETIDSLREKIAVLHEKNEKYVYINSKKKKKRILSYIEFFKNQDY